MPENINKSNSAVKIDLSYLNDVAGGSIEFMVEMIDMFLEQTPIYFESLLKEAQGKNWTAVADLAHKIKPTMAFIGADVAQAKMAEIEHRARNLDNIDEILSESGQLEELKSMFSVIFPQLQELKQEMKSKL